MTRIARRHFLALPVLIAGFLPAVACQTQESQAPPRTRPDVIIISVDTLRADGVGFGGRRPSPSPNIDQLARHGTVFTQAITPMPRTTPGLASLLTGLWPHHHGSREVGDPILEGTTLAEILKGYGYRTAAVSTNQSAGPPQALNAGFDRFVCQKGIHLQYRQILYRDGSHVPPTGIGWAETTTRESLRLVNEVPAQENLFLWVFYYDPHFMYRPPSPWHDEIAADRCWELYAWMEKNPQRHNDITQGRGPRARAALEDCSRLYHAEIAYTDAQIGALIEGLRGAGRWDNAIVVFTADHGENLGEAGLFFEHGENLHDASLRVPLVFRGPGIPQGVRRSDPATLIDILPTILGRLSLPIPHGVEVDGIDLWTPGRPDDRVVFAESGSALRSDTFELMASGRSNVRPCVHSGAYSLCEDRVREPGTFRLFDHTTDPRLEHDLADQHPNETAALMKIFLRWPPETARFRSARTGRFKMLRTPVAEGGYRDELFDLATDPAEDTDVSSNLPDITVRLKAELDRWTAGIESPLVRQVDPEIEAALQALGYLATP